MQYIYSVNAGTKTKAIELHGLSEVKKWLTKNPCNILRHTMFPEIYFFENGNIIAQNTKTGKEECL